MAAPEPKKRTYTLREVALSKKWDCEIDDLFYYAEEGKLQICKLHSDAPSLFLSDEENNARPRNEPIQISPHKARELYKIYYGFPGEMISLVITYEEKIRFEKEHMYDSTVGCVHSQEVFPSLDRTKDCIVWGYKLMAPIVGVAPSTLEKRVVQEIGFPLNFTEDGRPYCWNSRLQEFALKREKYKAGASPFPRKQKTSVE